MGFVRLILVGVFTGIYVRKLSFKLKKFLPSQKILGENEEGTLTLSYTVTSQNEVISLVKQWIPYMKVIAPESLVWMMRGVAKKYMASFEEGKG